MAFERERVIQPTGVRADVDAGLRAYMLKIYNYMALAMGLTGVVAFAVASSDTAMATIYGSGLRWVVALAPLGFILVLSFGIQKLSVGASQLLFWAFAGVMGLSMASIFHIYTGASIARAFFLAAAVFGAMSLYGYTTQRSLQSIGQFLIVGLIGLIIAMVVNIFMASSALDFAISIIGVLIFTGLTAYDTQKLKLMYQSADGAQVAEKKAIMGALTLYLDLLNLFMFLLHLMGNRE